MNRSEDNIRCAKFAVAGMFACLLLAVNWNARAAADINGTGQDFAVFTAVTGIDL